VPRNFRYEVASWFILQYFVLSFEFHILSTRKPLKASDRSSSAASARATASSLVCHSGSRAFTTTKQPIRWGTTKHSYHDLGPSGCLDEDIGTLRKASREFWHVAPRGFPAVNAFGRSPGGKKEVIGPPALRLIPPHCRAGSSATATASKKTLLASEQDRPDIKAARWGSCVQQSSNDLETQSA
jgi:hypothetical protein